MEVALRDSIVELEPYNGTRIYSLVSDFICYFSYPYPRNYYSKTTRKPEYLVTFPNLMGTPNISNRGVICNIISDEIADFSYKFRFIMFSGIIDIKDNNVEIKDIEHVYIQPDPITELQDIFSDAINTTYRVNTLLSQAYINKTYTFPLRLDNLTSDFMHLCYPKNMFMVNFKNSLLGSMIQKYLVHIPPPVRDDGSFIPRGKFFNDIRFRGTLYCDGEVVYLSDIVLDVTSFRIIR